jgi:hypothetical protein
MVARIIFTFANDVCVCPLAFATAQTTIIDFRAGPAQVTLSTTASSSPRRLDFESARGQTVAPTIHETVIISFASVAA